MGKNRFLISYDKPLQQGAHDLGGERILFRQVFFAQANAAFAEGLRSWPTGEPCPATRGNYPVGRCLERRGLLEQDADDCMDAMVRHPGGSAKQEPECEAGAEAESAWLEFDPAEDTDAMPHLPGSSVSYRVAVGPQQGRKAFMIRTIAH